MGKILVIIPSFMHGGTNRSFCNIIDLFDFHAHGLEVDLLCVKSLKDGAYYNEYVQRNINILRDGKLLTSLLGSHNRILGKLFRQFSREAQDYILKKICRRYYHKYKTVIAMEEGVTTRIASFIDAETKITWVRSMFENYLRNADLRFEKQYYEKINKIVCVSSACRNDFIKYLSEKQEDTLVINNMQNRESIIEKSKETSEFSFKTDDYNILSIGRLDKVKQFDQIPVIVRKLMDKGYSVKWYIIGKGAEKENIQNDIRANNVENNVILLGEKDNPYPYISMADLVAVTSKSESFCNVIVESGILGVPVITTDFPAVYETIQYAENVTIAKLIDFPKKIEEMYPEDKVDKPIMDIPNHEDKNIISFVKQLEALLC